MNVSEQFIRIGLQKGIFPFGYAVKMSTQWTYWTDYGNCFRLTQKYVEPLIPYATKYYELNVKKGGKVA